MRTRLVTLVTLALMLGFAAGAWAARKKSTDSSLYIGKAPAEAARALLEVAKKKAGNGSWENIALGRAYYLGGMKSEGQAIFDQVTKKAEGGDWIRLGRVYYEAGEWSKAEAAFDRALKLEPKDAPWLAEIGSFYNKKGDRAKAEELFTRSFKVESEEFWSIVNAAGSYLGVEPR